MGSPKSEVGDTDLQQGTDIWIPDGLLQSVSNTLRTYGARHDRDALDHQLSNESRRYSTQAVVAARRRRNSRTSQLGFERRNTVTFGGAWPFEPEAPLSRRNSIGPTSSRPPEQKEKRRANSISTFIPFQRQWRRRSTVQSSPCTSGSELMDTEGRKHSTKLASTADSALPDVSENGESSQQLRAPQRRFSTQPLDEVSNVGLGRRQRQMLGLDTAVVHRTMSLSIGPKTPVAGRANSIISNALVTTTTRVRQGSIWHTYEQAKKRQQQLRRSKAFQIFFQYTFYIVLLAFLYFVLVGRPLWSGVIWCVYDVFEHHLAFVGGTSIFVGLAFFYAVAPLLLLFENPAPMPTDALSRSSDDEKAHVPDSLGDESSTTDSSGTASVDKERQDTSLKGAHGTALLIPCYKSALLLPATLEAALKIFPASSIFILANGNSPTPLDNTEEVCSTYGVHHIWIPVGSKIVAQYVGAYVARSFPYTLLIDDDCLLPPNFPVVTDRLRGRVKVVGYTLTSIGAERSRGTWCQQAQDLEYKLSGLQRQFAGKIGSATFPHGAIVLWDTEFLIHTFKEHPGFSVSEDWFFGHVARVLGSRIIMCSSVFVETETPASLFFGSGGARGGFGEMTVFKQRFKRWNFFFVNGCFYNLGYILCSWRLGFWEIGTKLFVFQEVYETLLYLVTPLMLPISFLVRPTYSAYLFAATLVMYSLVSVVFNEVHLRLASRGAQKNLMVNRWMLLFYYPLYKIALTFVNVASCFWSLWMYAKYFATRHPRIVEDEKAVGVVVKIQEEQSAQEMASKHQARERTFSVQISPAESGPSRAMSRVWTRTATRSDSIDPGETMARRLTVTALITDVVLSSPVEELGDSIAEHDEANDTIHPIAKPDEPKNTIRQPSISVAKKTRPTMPRIDSESVVSRGLN